MGRAARFVLPVVVVASLWYVSAPPRSPDTYRERAAKTAATLSSQVQTARIWVRSSEDGEVTRQAATVGLREAEADANKAASKFETYDPPRGLVDLRSRVSSLAADVTDSLATLRIATAHEQWSQLPRLAEPLERLVNRLDELEKTAKP